VWLLLIDVPDHIGLGRFSSGAALTMATAFVCFGTLIVKLSARSVPNEAVEPLLASKARRVPLALILFALWATASALVHTSVAGAQNVVVYDTFVGAVLVCASVTSAGSAPRFLGRLNRAAWVVAGLYLVTVARDGFGASAVYGPRSVALAGLVLVAVAVSCRQRLLAVMLLLVIGSSLSRTATVVAIGLLCLGMALNGRRQIPRLGRIAVWSVAGVVASGLAVTRIAPLRERFLGGDNAFDYHGVSFNTAGRSQLWSYTWHLAHQHLLFGGGPGDAQDNVTARFAGEVNHPHNDYLRLLNDLGVVGLVLFLIGVIALLRGTWTRGRRTGEPVHWAAFLGVLGVVCAAVTDNVLVYPFVMVPLGVVVGLSLAHPVPEPPDETSAGAEAPPRGAISAAGAHQQRSSM
jgi:O-antigen ligase